jgi:hypothetical protein
VSLNFPHFLIHIVLNINLLLNKYCNKFTHLMPIFCQQITVTPDSSDEEEEEVVQPNMQ